MVYCLVSFSLMFSIRELRREETWIKIWLLAVFIIWALFHPLQKDLKEITDAFVYKPPLK